MYTRIATMVINGEYRMHRLCRATISVIYPVAYSILRVFAQPISPPPTFERRWTPCPALVFWPVRFPFPLQTLHSIAPSRLPSRRAFHSGLIFTLCSCAVLCCIAYIYFPLFLSISPLVEYRPLLLHDFQSTRRTPLIPSHSNVGQSHINRGVGHIKTSTYIHL